MKYFAPQNASGAVRPTKLAKFLTLSGEWEVYVVCGSPDDVGLNDELLEKDASLLAGVKYIEPTAALQLYNAVSGAAIRLLRGEAGDKPAYQRQQYSAGLISEERGFAAFKRTLMSRHFVLGQKLLAKSAAATAKKYYGDIDFDAIFTSHGPTMSDFAGLEAVRVWQRARWVADFRDFAYTPRVHPKSYKKYVSSLLSRVVSRADAVTSVIKEITQEDVFPSSDKYIELRLGFDRSDLEGISPAALPKDKLNIVYTGTFYPGFFDAFFSLLDECVAAPDINKDDFSFVYAGRHSSQLAEVAERRGYSDIFDDRGLLTRREALSLQLGADYILMCTSGNILAGGKGTERMMCARPMLAIVRRSEYGGPLEELAHERGMGIYQWLPESGEADYTAAASALCDAVRLKRAGKAIPYNPDENTIKSFSYENLAKRLSALLSGESDALK